MSFPQQLKLVLASQSVVVDRTPSLPFSNDTEIRIDELQSWCGTDNGGVAVSYFFRQYALFVSAQFHLLAYHKGYFKCPIKELTFNRVHNYGFHLLETHIASSSFEAIEPEDRFSAFHYVLHRQTADLIDEFRKYVKISPIILWDNVLGSLLWFYANLEQHNPRRAAEDLEWLMEAANWKPLRTSHLSRLLGDIPLQKAVTDPLRKTCCLYKELPSFGTCTFCPQPN